MRLLRRPSTPTCPSFASAAGPASGLPPTAVTGSVAARCRRSAHGSSGDGSATSEQAGRVTGTASRAATARGAPTPRRCPWRAKAARAGPAAAVRVVGWCALVGAVAVRTQTPAAIPAPPACKACLACSGPPVLDRTAARGRRKDSGVGRSTTPVSPHVAGGRGSVPLQAVAALLRGTWAPIFRWRR